MYRNAPGPNYRSKVGPPEMFDVLGAHQFCVMVKLGLRAHHTLLDFGCGCLRAGKYFINYLDEYNYTGIEPDGELLYLGIKQELGSEIEKVKSPRFETWRDFIFAARLPAKYDFILAHSILTHTGSDLLLQIASEAYKSLADDGVFVATFFEGMSNSTKTGWLGTGVAKYTFPYMSFALREAGFKSTEIRVLGHPTGQAWIVGRKDKASHSGD